MADSLDSDGISRPGQGPAGVGRTGRWLAILGTFPFVILAAWLYAIAPDHPWRAGTIMLLSTWSGLFLTFLGGIRWGVAMHDRRTGATRDLLVSVLPLGFGCAALSAPVPYVFAALAAIFAALGAWDSLASHAQAAPAWYGRLRVWQTIIIVVTLIVAFVATS